VRKTPGVFLVFAFLAFGYYYKAFLSGLMPAHLDAHTYTYPLKGLVRELYLSGMLPLWNIYEFSGFPLMAVSQTAVLYPFSVIPGLLLPEIIGYNADMTLHICLAGFFTYLYARRLGLGHFASFSAGVVFAFMGYLVRFTPQLSVVRSAAWIPFILYGFEGIRSRVSMRSCFPAAAGIAMQIYAGHPQVCFYIRGPPPGLFLYVSPCPAVRHGLRSSPATWQSCALRPSRQRGRGAGDSARRTAALRDLGAFHPERARVRKL
jgi:hypothetical protein